MLDDAERRVLADIEHRITEVDPMLALLARRHCAEARRREHRARRPACPAPAPRIDHRPEAAVPRRAAAEHPGLSVAVTVALVVVAGIALGLWLLVLIAIGVAFAAYLVRRRVTSRL